ncbi:MAG TPA: ATP-binding protein [Holophaga sp.]|nr:ATP-binding protein [Holophaga sp.]HPS66313.1 ATP-binding protein [Holophaga sp.]
MTIRLWSRLRLHFLRWFKSVHAKLFLVVGLLTSLLTLATAYTITENSRREMLDYTRKLAIQTSRIVASEIQERDKNFADPARIKEFLESLAGTDKSIDQIDVFKAEAPLGSPGGARVSFVTSSTNDGDVVWTPDIGQFMAPTAEGPASRLIDLIPSDPDASNGVRSGRASLGWEVYVPIYKSAASRAPIGLVRTYCDMERWEVVWHNNQNRTYRLLPYGLLAEFVLLWIVLSWLLQRPLRVITAAMSRLESGDPSARAVVHRKDELGKIADRFNLMATQLQKDAAERESMIAEIRELNAGLQERIDEALRELQLKNEELESLLRRIALLREELAQQERLAIAGQLTAAFAHEIGTPLNLVNSHLQLLLAQGDLSERARTRLGTIQAQITRVGDIVRKLLDNTRRPDNAPKPIAFSDLIADLERLWSPSLAKRDVAFRCSAPADCILMVDRKQMEQLFINLVNNAVDAMPEGGRIELRIERDDAHPARFQVALSDTGVGIPADVLPRIFRPMFTTKPEGQGTGLGLSICREIVRAHGGDIRVQSREGQGTTFHFTLPGAPGKD